MLNTSSGPSTTSHTHICVKHFVRSFHYVTYSHMCQTLRQVLPLCHIHMRQTLRQVLPLRHIFTYVLNTSSVPSTTSHTHICFKHFVRSFHYVTYSHVCQTLRQVLPLHHIFTYVSNTSSGPSTTSHTYVLNTSSGPSTTSHTHICVKHFVRSFHYVTYSHMC